MDPFLEPLQAESMLGIAESFGSFGTYADESTSEGLGETFPQRFDVALHYLQHGLDGDGGADKDDNAASRTNYFRETYAYGSELKIEGIAPFMNHTVMQAAARKISGCEEVVPAIVYANLLVPGQELAIHTDVPEFRGANRRNAPQWLLVCMLHSGLFDRWRIPILTCVSWFGAAAGGAFTFYPIGASGARESIPAQHNSAILIDTDRVFHGVVCRHDCTTWEMTNGRSGKGSKPWPVTVGNRFVIPFPGKVTVFVMRLNARYGKITVTIWVLSKLSISWSRNCAIAACWRALVLILMPWRC
jgi:hypothetical protein